MKTVPVFSISELHMNLLALLSSTNLRLSVINYFPFVFAILNLSFILKYQEFGITFLGEPTVLEEIQAKDNMLVETLTTSKPLRSSFSI